MCMNVVHFRTSTSTRRIENNEKHKISNMYPNVVEWLENDNGTAGYNLDPIILF